MGTKMDALRTRVEELEAENKALRGEEDSYDFDYERKVSESKVVKKTGTVTPVVTDRVTKVRQVSR